MKNFNLEEHLSMQNTELNAANFDSIGSVFDTSDKFEEVLQNTYSKQICPFEKSFKRKKDDLETFAHL